MPGTFGFSNGFTSNNFIPLTSLSKGAASGIDNPGFYSALGGSFLLNPNHIAVAPIAIQQGHVLRLDLDFGNSNNIDAADFEIRLIDAQGDQVAFNDTGASTDSGSPTTVDPKLQFTAPSSGLYYVVVTQKENDYIDGSFNFDNGGTDGGVFQLNVAIQTMAALVTGTANGDSVTLTTSQRRYAALGGDDYVTASNANTIIDGGNGNDYLYGGAGQDILSGGALNDYLQGGGSRDILVGGSGSDQLQGVDGNDQAFGGDGADNLYGGDDRDLLVGEEDSDFLDGGAGADTLRGGSDNDTLMGSLGNDHLNGGAGVDQAYYYNATGSVTVDLSLTTAQYVGADGTDRLVQIENVTGSNGFGDTITGSGDSNSLSGYGGNDLLGGAGGNDYIAGGLGNDTLIGGAGQDYVYGDEGQDKLTGGGAADSFYFGQASYSTNAAPDWITDFSTAQGDRIHLYNVFDPTLDFIGAAAFSGTPGEVRVVTSGSNQLVQVNLDTDDTPEMKIVVTSATTLVEADFYL